MKMPNLGCLYLKGNPFFRECPNYRRRFIAQIPSLKYLDDRPVFTDERRISEAFLRGGKEAEN